MTDKVLLIPRIKVQNANALSSPFTIGFPAMTAWLGAVHALQRALNLKEVAVNFDGVGVISHQFNLQTYKGRGDFEYSIIGTSNPLDKDGSRPSFIEEARCHLEASLVVKCSNIRKSDEQRIIEIVSHHLNSRMKIAGGDILAFDRPEFFREFSLLKYRLMPGYALLERRDLMIEGMQEGNDALDVLLDYLAIHHNCEQKEQNGEVVVNWSSEKTTTGCNGERGWIVPIATGFQAISDLGLAKNQRDPETLHRFAEAIVTLGEFKMVYKLRSIQELLWRYHYDADNHLYVCQQTLSDQKTLLEEDGF